MMNEALTSAVALLQAMVRVNTVNSGATRDPQAEAPLTALLEELAGELGFATRRLPVPGLGDNLLLTHEVDPTAPWLLFESHIDTVTTDGMIIDPWGAELRDGRIWGRGACDTKGTGAAMLWALRDYAASGAAGNNVALVFALDEESFMRGSAALAGEQLGQLGFRPAGVVVGEPTRQRPVIAHNGLLRWAIRTEGVACHSSDPGRGLSAITIMAAVVQAIEAHYIPQLAATHPLTGKAQCSINTIRGGALINVIPDSCVIELDRRVVPGEDLDAILPAVEAVLAPLRAANPSWRIVQEPPTFKLAPLDPAGNEDFHAFVASVLAAQGLPTELYGEAYGTDASNFSEAGLASIVIGPGSIEQAHTKDEWLDLDEFHRGLALYHGLMATRWE